MHPFWSGKRVVVTGHTGFKGAWLCLWLLRLGASVRGLSLAPPTEPSLFDQVALRNEMGDRWQDLRDAPGVTSTIRDFTPEVIFHLGAQSLVTVGYDEPRETWNTNLIGTLNVLEALREHGQPCSVVIATTDKVYENQESGRGYIEDDPLGGHDPYSASKAACELLAASYRSSFLRAMGIRVATARAGNVIGGGDWARDRIVPDIIRSRLNGDVLCLRRPQAIRPWQHVLEPLSGYLRLAEQLAAGLPGRDEAFNFGPKAESHHTVGDLVSALQARLGGDNSVHVTTDKPHETELLALNADKAERVLDWSPHWDFDATLNATASWYRAVCWEGRDARAECVAQIQAYEDVAA